MGGRYYSGSQFCEESERSVCVTNNLVAGIDGEVVFSTFGSQVAVCVAVICKPVIKRES